MQAEKVNQLYHFAEFGRMASGLFHDLANPLGLISLNLTLLNKKNKQMKREEIEKLLNRAFVGTKRLEDFVLAARKQINHQAVLKLFSLNDLISQAIRILP